ncbi:hypothetical protein F4679DRAFT_53875 [Xylaria curta]|nr:hypothetical protein F4679DRAFT_53875 [Xylaria curta]
MLVGYERVSRSLVGLGAFVACSLLATTWAVGVVAEKLFPIHTKVAAAWYLLRHARPRHPTPKAEDPACMQPPDICLSHNTRRQQRQRQPKLKASEGLSRG